MGILVTLLLLLFTSSPAFADWYILIPKKLPKEKKKFPKNAPIPKLGPTKKNLKPYKVEVRRLLAPNFSVRTPRFKKISLQNLNGKKVVVAFVKNVYSPLSEGIIYKLSKIKDKDTEIIVIDVNDSDFPLLERFKREMGVKKLVLTADSYVFKEFKSKIDIEVPSLVIIDRYGFIRYLAKNINSQNLKNLDKEINKILASLS